MKRALAQCTIWTTDEGLNGVDIHVANDGPARIGAWLRVVLYRAGERCVGEADLAVTIPEHRTLTFGAEQILGRFADAAYAYRFGPAGHDLIAVSLHKDRGDIPFAQSFRFPAGRTVERMPVSELGLAGQAKVLADGRIEVQLSSRRFAWGVRVAAPGLLPDDAYFGIEPGGARRIVMTHLQSGTAPANVVVTAINAEGRIPLAVRWPT